MKVWEMLCEESLMNATGYAAYFCKLLKLKTWKALFFTTMKEHAKKFEELQIEMKTWIL